MIKLRICLLTTLLLTLPLSATLEPEGLSKNYNAVDENQPVLCLLPGRVRRLGGQMVYQERRRPEQLLATECEIRGGEYTVYDRTNAETALAVWLDQAKAGDATAQLYVGEIYQKGWLGSPDYAEAAKWYQQAAEEGDARAQRRLAYLFEQGLGVDRDPQRAMGLWRDALGLQDEVVLASVARADQSAQSQRVERLLAELEQQNLATGRLQRSLVDKEAQLNSQASQLQQVKTDLAALRDSTTPADTSENEALQQQLAEREAQALALQDTIDVLQLQVAAAEQQIQASNQQADLRKRQLLRAREENQLLAAQSEQQQATADAALAREAERSTSLARQIQASENQAAAAQAELEETRAELAMASSQLASLNDQVNENVEAIKAAIPDPPQEWLEGGQQALQNLREQIADLEAERNQQNQHLQTLRNEHAELTLQLRGESETRRWLEVELEAARSEAAQAQEALRATDRALSHAEFEKAQLRTDMERLERDLDTERQRGDQDRRSLLQELERQRSQLARLDYNVTDLRRQRAQQQATLDDLNARQEGDLIAMRGLSLGSEIEPIPLPERTRTGPYRALIIANHDYRFLPDLTTPPSDARKLKQILEQRYGFEVDLRINLDRKGMYRALHSVRQYGESEFVLLYYAGHGKMDEYGDGYWLPTDYREGEGWSEAVSNSEITQTLNQSPAKHVLLVADSCYAGALLRESGPVASAQVPALIDFWLANRSRTALTSGGLQPVLDTGPSDNSVFAGALLAALQRARGAFNAEMLYTFVHDQVVRDAAQLGYLDQKPQFAAIEDAGHENGQFVFAPRGG